jgi:tetratricopeptide (TPR) repeat protein
MVGSEAVDVCRRLDEQHLLAEALHVLGHYYLDPGTDYAAARAHFDESAAHYRAVGDNWGVGWSLHCMATSVWFQLRDNETARRAYEESLRLFRSVGDENMAAHPISTLGVLAFERGEHRRGRELVAASVARFRAFNDRHYLALQLNRAGDLACADGDSEAADRAYRESLTLSLESGFKFISALEGFAMLAAAQEQPERALHLAGAATSMRDSHGLPRKPAERARLDGALTAARAALGPAGEAAWERGRRMSAQEAVDLALAMPVGPGAQAMSPAAAPAGRRGNT